VTWPGAAEHHPRLHEVDLVSLADQVFTVFEGGFVLARATDDWSHLGRQLGHLRHYVEFLLAPSPGGMGNSG
jgi:hypothetical protein